MTKISLTRILAVVIAVGALVWLVNAVNTHGNDAQRGLQNALHQSAPIRSSTRSDSDGGGGLELVDMYQCMCVSNQDLRPWIRWWLIAAAFGGLPVAILLRSRMSPRSSDSDL